MHGFWASTVVEHELYQEWFVESLIFIFQVCTLFLQLTVPPHQSSLLFLSHYTHKQALDILSYKQAACMWSISAHVEDHTCFVCNVGLNKIMWPGQVFFIQYLHKRKRKKPLNSRTLLLYMVSCYNNPYSYFECAERLTFFWHLGHIHMPLGGDLSGGCKQSRW